MCQSIILDMEEAWVITGVRFFTQIALHWSEQLEHSNL